MILSPRSCRTMPELRMQIDVLDAELIGLLQRRAEYIARAAEIKQNEDLPARIEWRVEEVLAKARENAEMAGLDPQLAETLWREMIEWSIRKEAATLEKEAT